MVTHLEIHILRKSPKQSAVADLRGELERGVVPDFHRYNPHVLASTLKEYLRSIPNKLLLNGNYHLWMTDVVDQPIIDKKVLFGSFFLSS